MNVGKGRLTQVFKYLQALNNHRNPAKRVVKEQPWLLWTEDLPDHPSIHLVEAIDPPPAPDAESIPEAPDYLLRVSRPALTRTPAPPESIAEWLLKGYEDPDAEVRIQESRNEVDGTGTTVLSVFSESDERIAAFATWKEQREKWAAAERPARAAMRVFEQLYELHGRLQREAERVELVLGDGVLHWNLPDGAVHHPVLLQRVQLDFDATVPEFKVIDAGFGIELYSALFSSLPGLDGRLIGKAAEELVQGGYQPLGKEDTSGFLRKFVQILSARGEFKEAADSPGPFPDPVIVRKPALFLRNRTLGFASALDGVLQDLKTREDPTESLLNVVGSETAAPEEPDQAIPPDEELKGPASEILLSKPANPEQIRIIEQLERRGSVLVQGPPGTGKTHTIANLIGHLLAEGKTVLVTAHTAKALHVIRSQVVERLRPLCVSVLENDLHSRDELSSSIEGIVGRLTDSDVSDLHAKAESFAGQHEKLIERIRETQKLILEARTSEYRELVMAGQAFAPSDAARKVTAEASANGWIPQPVAAGGPMPLSAADVAELYRSNASLSPLDERELETPLPRSVDLASPDDFERLILARQSLAAVDRNLRADLWARAPVPGDEKELEAVSSAAAAAVEPLGGKEAWKLEIILAGEEGGDRRVPWENLIRQIQELKSHAAQCEESLLRHDPALPPALPLEQAVEWLQEILAHMKGGGGLGKLKLLVHPSWRKFIQESRVAGDHPPSKPEHFQALLDLATLRQQRAELKRRWDAQMAKIGAPPGDQLGERPEVVAAQFVPSISDCLDWKVAVWKSLEAGVSKVGFRWNDHLKEQPPTLDPRGALARIRTAVSQGLPQIFSSRLASVQWEGIETQRRAIASKLEGGTPGGIVGQMLKAVTDSEASAYRQALGRLVELERKRAIWNRRKELLSSLEKAAPGWAASIRERKPRHDGESPPGDPQAAWVWRQLEIELRKRSEVSIPNLQRTLENFQRDQRRVTSDLIDSRAWAAQMERTSLQQRQALVGWAKTIARIGKGTGKRVPLLQAEARRLLGECRASVPVWIMPLARVVESFDPRKTRFDVVIIDEASQADVMALIAMYLGRKTVIVGDSEQVSPSAVGQNLAVVQSLIDQFLDGVPNSHLYDGQMSVFDLAQTAFGGVICLLEHFRCAPAIIHFSNGLSYQGRLKPLRDSGATPVKPNVIAYRIEGAASDEKVNPLEAETLAALLVSCAEQPEYKDATFGVVSLVGEEQAIEIEKILRHRLSEREFMRRQILCGNAAHFQGDERDVMFLSVVDSGGGGPLALRAEKRFQQRFNVAASRARNQMWVVHSLDAQRQLKEGDLRKRLIDYAENPEAIIRNLETSLRKAESEFEKLVIRRLVDRGYRVRPQYTVGYYRIDMVVEGGGKQLAIECDGDRFHPIEKLPEDMARQAILERLGWTFVRIRGTQFFRDPEAAMRPVFETLEKMEIPAVGPADVVDANGADSSGKELKERIVRRAAELRSDWSNASESEGYVAPTAPRPGRKTRAPKESVHSDLVPMILGVFQGNTEPLEAREIATRLNTDPSAVNRLLYSDGTLQQKLEKVDGEKWRLR